MKTRLTWIGVVSLMSVLFLAHGQNLHAEALGRIRLSKEELNFVAESCPDINKTTKSGCVVAYGSIIKPPIQISNVFGKVYANGIQIYPRKENPSKSLAQREFCKIHEWFRQLKKNGETDIDKKLKDKLTILQKKGNIASFSFGRPEGSRLTVTFPGGQEIKRYLDGFPVNVLARFDFILSILTEQYIMLLGKAERNKALDWMESRFDDLKRLRIVEHYKINRDLSTVNFRHVGCDYDEGMGFGPARTQHGKDRMKKEREVAEKQAEKIRGLLNSNKILIYSYGFEKSIDLTPDVMKALDDIKRDEEIKKATSLLSKRLGLSRNNSFWQELSIFQKRRKEVIICKI